MTLKPVFTTSMMKEWSSIQIKPAVQNNLFECENLEFIQQSQVCDGRADCRDGTDETNCCE